MCRTQSFKYTVCGHTYAKVLSACGGSTTHTTKAGITKASCNPMNGIKKNRGGLTLHFAVRCAHCTKELFKAHSQLQVDKVKAHSKTCPPRTAQRRVRRAERTHQETCEMLDQQFKITAPVPKRDIVLPPPQIRKRAVGGSPLRKVVTFDTPDIKEAEEYQIPASFDTQTKIKLPVRAQNH